MWQNHSLKVVKPFEKNLNRCEPILNKIEWLVSAPKIKSHISDTQARVFLFPRDTWKYGGLFTDLSVPGASPVIQRSQNKW